MSDSSILIMSGRRVLPADFSRNVIGMEIAAYHQGELWLKGSFPCAADKCNDLSCHHLTEQRANFLLHFKSWQERK